MGSHVRKDQLIVGAEEGVKGRHLFNANTGRVPEKLHPQAYSEKELSKAEGGRGKGSAVA